MTTPTGPPGSGDWAAPGAAEPPPGWSANQPPPWSVTMPYAAPPPPRPGIIPLRPLGVGEILDGAFTLLRRHPRPTLGFAAVVMLFVETVRVLSDYSLLSSATAPVADSPLSDWGDYAARAGVASFVSLAVTGLATLLLTGAVTTVVGQAVLGRPMSPGDAWRTLRPVFGRLVGVSLLTWLAIAALLSVSVVPGLVLIAAGSGDAGAALAVIGFLVALVPAVWLWTSWALAPAALVLEKQPVVAALRRSRALVRGSWWRVFGILLLAAVIASMVNAVIGVPFGIVGGGISGFGGNDGFDVTGLAVSALGGLIAGTIVRPFSAGVVALLYIDRRMRAEALDLALARAVEPAPA